MSREARWSVVSSAARAFGAIPVASARLAREMRAQDGMGENAPLGRIGGDQGSDDRAERGLFRQELGQRGTREL
jgi:hypothetical protein